MKSLQFILLALFVCSNTFAQVGINTTEPDFSSILDIKSNDKGVLFPRLTMEQRDNIVIAASEVGQTVPGGLTIYCTDCCSNGTGGALFYYNGAEWKSLDSDCSIIGDFPVCNPVTTTFLEDNHLEDDSIPLFFDNNITEETQPDTNILRLHHNDDDIVEFTLNEPLPAGGKIVLYWSDAEEPGGLGLIVDLANGATTSQPSIDTLSGILPNSTNTNNGGDNFILSMTLIANTDTITVRSFDDDDGDDPFLLEFKIFDNNDVEIPLTCD